MKLLIILCATISCFLPNNYQTTFASSHSVQYAKAKQNCLLFVTSDTDLELETNVYFEVPEGYFVSIITPINSSVLKVKYDNIVGFVKSESVCVVSGVPTTPTLQGVTFDISPSSSTQLRSSPSSSFLENIVTIIPSTAQQIKYIACATGETPPSGKSNKWYYCLYSPENDPVSVYYGYVYSEKCTNLSAIAKNTEFDEELQTQQTSITQPNYIYLSGGVRATLIVIICLPIVVIFVLLLLMNKRQDKSIEKLSKNAFFRKKESKTVTKQANEPTFPVYDFDDEDLL